MSSCWANPEPGSEFSADQTHLSPTDTELPTCTGKS